MTLPTQRELSSYLKGVYAPLASRMTPQQRFVSVYRPYYSPVHALLRAVPEGSNVLEVGCGNGPILLLLEHFRSLRRGLGVDIQAVSIEIAQAAAAGIPHLEFAVRDVHTMNEADARDVDVLLCVDVLHHLPLADKAPFLGHLASILRPGRRLVLKDLDARPRRKAWANRVTDYLSTRSHVSYWRQSQAESFLRGLGLDVVSTEALHDWVWSHYMIVAVKPT